MAGVMMGVSRGCHQERSIFALHESHQADKTKLEGGRARRRSRRAREVCTGGSRAAENNSTDKVTTIHLCSYCFGGLSIGAVYHQRGPSAESTAILLNCVALDLCEGFRCRDRSGHLAVEPYYQFAGFAFVCAGQCSKHGRYAGGQERRREIEGSRGSIILLRPEFVQDHESGVWHPLPGDFAPQQGPGI